jgi:phage-related protein
MKTIPTILIEEKNKLATPNPWIVLLDVNLSTNYKLYFCSNNEDVLFKRPGDSVATNYIAMPFDLDPNEQTSKGEIPTITLKICNTTYVIHQYLEILNGGVGAEVTVYVVNAAYLTQNYADLTMTFTVISTSADAEWVYFQLGAASPLRRRFPLYRVIADHCMWEFNKRNNDGTNGDGTQVECSYSGTFKTCDRSFKDCDERRNTERFGGFKGISVYGWRAV